MRQPKLANLKIDWRGTKAIRRGMAKSKKVKITINIDKDSLLRLRKKAAGTGIPYQRLLNQTLKAALEGDAGTESRLERLEKELERLKRKVAA